MNTFLILLNITIWAVVTNIHLDDTEGNILAAVKDSGSSCHPHKVIEQKQVKDTYNYDSLKGNE